MGDLFLQLVPYCNPTLSFLRLHNDRMCMRTLAHTFKKKREPFGMEAHHYYAAPKKTE